MDSKLLMSGQGRPRRTVEPVNYAEPGDYPDESVLDNSVEVDNSAAATVVDPNTSAASVEDQNSASVENPNTSASVEGHNPSASVEDHNTSVSSSASHDTSFASVQSHSTVVGSLEFLITAFTKSAAVSSSSEYPGMSSYSTSSPSTSRSSPS